MRMSAYVITAVLSTTLSGAAMAQSAPPAAVPAATPAVVAGETQSHWTVAGFVGSNYGKSTVDPSVSFGGQIAYLWRGVVGGEVIADFAPSFKLDSAALAENPRTNAYMGNAIFALPLGASGEWQPFVSGGAGSISLRAVVFNAFLPQVSGLPLQTGTSVNDQFKFGWDVGAGIMGFKGMVGFRADARYFKTESNSTNQTTPIGEFTDSLLTGLDFWRANIGVVVRW